jgi:hypothetical protein
VIINKELKDKVSGEEASVETPLDDGVAKPIESVAIESEATETWATDSETM